MNCYICDKNIDEIHVDPDLRPAPCSECLGIIAETVAEMENEDDDADSDLDSGVADFG